LNLSILEYRDTKGPKLFPILSQVEFLCFYLYSDDAETLGILHAKLKDPENQ
jgi:hypothetical protein